MSDLKQFEDLAKKLYESLPSSVKHLDNEVQQKFKEILQSAFSHFDLITREEFDVQTKVLARTREKVENLQAQVNAFLAETK